jgi:NAD(P)-dependent dehydrogenase (short-subunit alcohol dehydrogenase family)
MSSFWYPNTGADTIASSSYKSIDINVTHPIRATQLAIDYFLRQKLGHGAVLLISSIAAQMPLLPIPLYTASKHAISGFTRSLAHLEPGINIRVNAIAPGVVKTPIWSADKAARLDETQDTWVTIDKVVDVMIDLITKSEHFGGTVLEVGVDLVRPVQELNDPGPSGRGTTVAHAGEWYADVYKVIEQNFGK